MLIKIDAFRNEWINPDHIESIKIHALGVNDYRVYINMTNNEDSYRADTCDTYKEAVKVMNELAEKINAAQGCKPATKKTVMKYEEHGDEAIVGVYRCSRCKTVIRDEHSWYKFCPACGRETERWE